MARILIGCVTYDHHSFVLGEFLDTLKGQTLEDFDVFFVDNSTTETYAAQLREKGYTVVYDPPGVKNKIQRIVSGRQRLREYFLNGSWEYLLFLDTDILMPPDTVQKLVSYNKDIVSGVCPSMMIIEGKQGVFPTLYDFAGPGQCRQMTIEEVENPGIQEIDACGFGCVLIKREVVEKVSIRYYLRSQAGEDIAFNVDAHKHGFKTFVDKSVKCRHVTKLPRWPLEIPPGDRVTLGQSVPLNEKGGIKMEFDGAISLELSIDETSD